MTSFTQAVDAFLAAPKAATGTPAWKPARTPPDKSWAWLLIVDGTPSDHRLCVEARLGDDGYRFCIMVQFVWSARHIPVLRLNFDTDAHGHANRFDRPPHLPAMAYGPRVYLWADNRHAFTPSMEGLPYAAQLERKHHRMDNAIRFLAGAANIDLANLPLPTYPSREGLFG
jgi:hypothetical protein